MRVIVASGLGGAALRRCLDALLATAGEPAPDVHVIRERATREATWNAGLEAAGRDEDVLFLGDDVVLTPGWREALARGAREAGVVGLATLDPATGRVSDRGYDLVRRDGQVTVEARDRGRSPETVAPFDVRPCDAVCGCAFLARAEVLRAVPRFREAAGANRWGELVFALEARRAGARIAVVDHRVPHAGTGSKTNPDPRLASTSWSVERAPWERLVARFVDPAWVRETRRTELDPSLRRPFEDPGSRVLVYGVGTVADALARRLRLEPDRVTFCSGLPEEAGSRFHGHAVRAAAEVPLERYDWIVLTPLGRGADIWEGVLRPRLGDGFGGRVAVVERRREGVVDRLCARELGKRPDRGRGPASLLPAEGSGARAEGSGVR